MSAFDRRDFLKRAGAAGVSLGLEKKTRVYELRTYTVLPGRLPALHKRFADHTMKLFEKHGMKNEMYWTLTDDTRKDMGKEKGADFMLEGTIDSVVDSPGSGEHEDAGTCARADQRGTDGIPVDPRQIPV